MKSKYSQHRFPPYANDIPKSKRSILLFLLDTIEFLAWRHTLLFPPGTNDCIVEINSRMSAKEKEQETRRLQSMRRCSGDPGSRTRTLSQSVRNAWSCIQPLWGAKTGTLDGRIVSLIPNCTLRNLASDLQRNCCRHQNVRRESPKRSAGVGTSNPCLINCRHHFRFRGVFV